MKWKMVMPEAEINIPYAIANFAELRLRKYYYVDKTQYIPKLERYKAPVFLRPRRFGKSLLISTLDHYYNRAKADLYDQLFAGTWIGEHPTPEHSQYMVARYDFSIVDVAEDLANIERNFNNVQRGVLKITVEHNRDILGDFAFSSEDSASGMLAQLCQHISKKHLPPLYILIDEYDNFTNQLLVAYKDTLYEDVTTGDSFLRTFFKVVKAGIGEGTIRSCFCTGVLPVTMDDLTSGYNIAEMLTLKPEFTAMLGFTHAETTAYLRYVIDRYDPPASFDELWSLIVNNYDGYRFLPQAELMFNSTILTYFLKNFAEMRGGIPDEMVDENLRTDVSWIRRLTITLENAKEMLDTLVVDGEMSFLPPDLRSKFNKRKFFSPRFYPVSLFYLGLTTLKSAYTMVLPNLTARNVYMDYYNELNQISNDTRRFTRTYERFVDDGVLEPVFYNFCEQHLGQLPAQVFDKVNENFVRCAFFEVMYRYLSWCFTFALEQNLPSGRADLVMTGNPGTAWHNDCRVVEMKYHKAAEAAAVDAMTEPPAADAAQARAYARDINEKFPAYRVRAYVAHLAASKAAKIWEVTEAKG